MSSGELRRGPAALLGVLALVAAPAAGHLAAGHLVAGFVGVNASPYLAVGNGAIDLTPVWLKDFTVRTVGTYDKLVLLSEMAVVLVLVAAVAGLLSRRTPVPGLVVITGLGLVGLVAVYVRPDLGAVALSVQCGRVDVRQPGRRGRGPLAGGPCSPSA